MLQRDGFLKHHFFPLSLSNTAYFASIAMYLWWILAWRETPPWRTEDIKEETFVFLVWIQAGTWSLLLMTLRYQLITFPSLLVTCSVCINADYFAPAAACPLFNFKQENVLLFEVCWYSLALLKNSSYNNQNVGKECHKIVNVCAHLGNWT